MSNYGWTNEDGEPIMDGAAYRFEQALDADYAEQRYLDDDEFFGEPDECDPKNSYCVYDNDDCHECEQFWLDFHADGMEDQWLDGSYEE